MSRFKRILKKTSIPTKFFLLVTSIISITCLLIGLFSYTIAKNALITNSKESSANIVTQSMSVLDQRITQIRQQTFQLSQDNEIVDILLYPEEELSPVILGQQNSSFRRLLSLTAYNLSYIDDAYLSKTGSNSVRSYHNAKSNNDLTAADLASLYERVEDKRVYSWLVSDGDTYFIRRIIDIESNEEYGFICLKMNSSFFLFEGSSDFLSDEYITILNEDGKIMKEGSNSISKDWSAYFTQNDTKRYATYTNSIEYDQEKYVLNLANLENEEWVLIGVTPEANILSRITPIITSILIISIILGLLLTVLSNYMSKSIVANIAVIKDGIKEYEKGNFLNEIKPVNDDELGLLAIQFNNMGHRLDELIHQLNEEQEAMRNLEFQSLKAQINPHFLYNTLGSVRWSSFNKKEYETAAAIESIINLLRITIKNSESLITLKEELAYVTDYLTIQKMRYGEALTYSIRTDPDILGIEIAGFFIQPFIENSILHGFDFSERDGVIGIDCKGIGDHIQVTISDNGIGMSAEKVQELLSFKQNNDKRQGFNGLGIPIIYSRLSKIYKDDFTLDIHSVPNEGTIITIIIPK